MAKRRHQSDSPIGLLIIPIALGIFLLYSSNEKKDTFVLNLPNLGELKGSVTYTKWTNQTILQFLGIPFAKPTSGNLRFRPPVTVSKWDGIKDATKYGKRCPELESLSTNNLEDDLEDCLNLCVFTKNVTQKQPVMVFIHGGAFFNGTASEHPPGFLLEKDVVYVALQYRLGALGFLSTRTEEIPGNMGILDVILALEWIKENIQYFGGDPNNVTIFGHSAGAIIVSLLLVTPKANHQLFHKAVIQSGSALMTAAYNSDPLNIAKNVCNQLECELCQNIVDINRCLKNAPLQSLLSAKGAEIGISFGLSTHDFEEVIPQSIRKLVRNTQNKIPVMAGVTKNDGGFLVGAPLENMRDFLERLLSSENNESGTLLNFMQKLYFKEGELDKESIKELMPKFVDIASTVIFKLPLQQFLQLYFKNNSENIYLYTFDYLGSHSYIPQVSILKQIYPFFPILNGVHHADELLYLFPTKELNEQDMAIAKQVVELWTSFVINGEPSLSNMEQISSLKDPLGPYFHIDKKLSNDTDFYKEYFSAGKY